MAIDTTISNSTISGNTATSEGGGFYNEAGTSTIINTTIAGNTAPADSGGGITSFGDTELRNVIVAGNNGGNCADAFSNFISLGHNLESGHGLRFSGVGDLQATDPLLGPLATTAAGRRRTR